MSRPRVLSSLRRDFNEAELELKEYVIDTLAFTKRKISKMRESINLDSKGIAISERGKIARIRNTRGAFLWLPVKYDNDLIHGSWWFVYGSFMSTLIPIIPLIDIHTHFFHEPEGTQLTAFANSSTWIFLIISGVFFTVGSWVFIRAFENPPPEPFFKDIHHLCTDELLGAWIFLFAMIPAIPYCIVFLAFDHHNLTYVAALFASIFFVAGSAFFVYTCYPSVSEIYHAETPHYVLPLVERIFGKNSWICKHVKTDWLVSCWCMYYSTFLWMFGSYVELFNSKNDRQLFIWLTSFFNALLFLIGSAYYISGSYVSDHAAEEFDQYAKEVDDDGTIIAYFANLGKNRKKPKILNTTVNVIHETTNTTNVYMSSKNSDSFNEANINNTVGFIDDTNNDSVTTDSVTNISSHDINDNTNNNNVTNMSSIDIDINTTMTNNYDDDVI